MSLPGREIVCKARPYISAAAGALIFSLPAAAVLLPDYTDLRYQEVGYSGFSVKGYLLCSLLMFAHFTFQTQRLCRCGYERAASLFCKTYSVLLLWFPLFFLPEGFIRLSAFIAVGAWAEGRAFAVLPECKEEKKLSSKEALQYILLAALAVTLNAGAAQYSSLNKLAMQWLDWGHFYESLKNTLDGRFFYLNLENGSYLGSRFCPSLLVLLPVVMLRSPGLFLLTGALLVASGALLVVLAAKVLRFPPGTALLLGIWYLVLPLTLNMMMPLLDGFHEVFLLIPAVLGAWICYRKKYYFPAAVLVLFTFGIRETVGFMWAGYGIVLLCEKDYRRGVILTLFSIFMLVFLIGFLMPRLSSQTTYLHTVFFPHLGNSTIEIALSPFTRPGIFFSSLFSRHNLVFWITLLLPFIWAAAAKPLYWLPMLPDLLMISLDSRFDTQTIFRHNQCVPFLVLTIASVEGLYLLRRNKEGKIAKYIWKYLLMRGSSPARGALGALLASAALSAWCFTQIPGTPASDKRLPEWSDARLLMKEFFKYIEPGSKITAGPRIASFCVNDYDLYILRNAEEKLQDYVFIESFEAMYGENIVRRKLLSERGWELLHSAFLDERLLQLFRRKKDAAPLAPVIDNMLWKPHQREWESFGAPIKSPLKEVELRGRMAENHLLIGVKLIEKVDFDIGCKVEMKFSGDLPRRWAFNTFGDEVLPADMATPGKVWIMKIPLTEMPVECKVDLVVIPK